MTQESAIAETSIFALLMMIVSQVTLSTKPLSQEHLDSRILTSACRKQFQNKMQQPETLSMTENTHILRLFQNTFGN